MSDNPEAKFEPMGAQQRVGPLVHLPGVLREFGVSVARALEGAGIEPSAFEAPDNRIPFSAATAVLARCTELTRCPHFGLLLGAKGDHRDMGLAGRLMAHAPNLETALRTFVLVQQANSGGGCVYVHRFGEHWLLGYGIYEANAVAQAQIYPLVMALGVNTVRSLTRGAVKPVEVLLPMSRPANVKPYRAVLGGSVRFSQPEAAIVLPQSALDAPVYGAKPDEFARLREFVARQTAAPDADWTARVKHAVRPLILRGEPTTDRMAALLGVNVRTLARHLATEGTTFQTLIGVMRYGMARELLSMTALSVGEVADALAYSHQSGFAHAFRQWSGQTPSEWRSTVCQI